MPLASLMLTAFAAVAGLSGCASVNSVSLTPIPAHRALPVKAEASKTIFLAFNFDNDFVDEIVEDLKRQCPKGVVSGILTKDETISYFLVFKRHVVATGYCNGRLAKRDASGRSTASQAVTDAATSDSEASAASADPMDESQAAH